MPGSRLTGWRLALHVIAPSGIGATLYFVCSSLVLGAHLLYISLSGQAYPALFNETLMLGYANFIIQPIATITNNRDTAVLIAMLAGGAVGLALYEIISWVFHAATTVKSSQEDVGHPQLGATVAHPLSRQVIFRLLWQLCVLALAVIGLIAVAPVLHHCIQGDLHVMRIRAPLSIGAILAGNVVLLMAVLHTYAVLARLYLLRTRVFGEILY